MITEQDKLAAIRFYRSMTQKPKEEWDGTLEQAIRQAEEFTRDYGQKAFVVRKKNKYEWVAEGYFKTYKYEGKIFHETIVDLDYEI